MTNQTDRQDPPIEEPLAAVAPENPGTTPEKPGIWPDKPAVTPENETINEYMPVLSMQEAQRRFNYLRQFVRENMRRDVDYGVIPGTSDKPTLLKPGAEKLCTFFGLRSSFEIIDSTQEWERGFFNYWYKCRLFRGEQCTAEGEGSANSYERKYRWRSVPAFKATDEERGRAVREEMRRSRDGRPYKVLLLENDDPYTLVNTLQKMAQKRALIAATLIAVNASEFFTQDIEDMVPDAYAEPVGSDYDSQPAITRPAASPSVPETPEPERAQTSGQGGVGGNGGGGASPEPVPGPSALPAALPAAQPAEFQPAAAQQAQLFDEAPPRRVEEVLLRFKDRPSRDTLDFIKAAGFRWDPKKVTWHAPVNPERQSIRDELSQKGALAA